MLLARSVAAGAEVRPLDRAETESVLVVVARRAETAAHLTGRRITDESSRGRRRGSESVRAKRCLRGSVAVERALKAAGEVLAGQRLLVLGLVTAAALAVGNRAREVGMTVSRVTLPAANALGRVAAFGVVRDRRAGVTLGARLDVGDRSRDGLGVRPVRRPRQQEAAGHRKGHGGNHEAAGGPR